MHIEYRNSWLIIKCQPAIFVFKERSNMDVDGVGKKSDKSDKRIAIFNFQAIKNIAMNRVLP